MVHVNGELQDVLLRGACRQALFDALSPSPSSAEAPVGSLPVPPLGTVVPRRRHGNFVSTAASPRQERRKLRQNLLCQQVSKRKRICQWMKKHLLL